MFSRTGLFYQKFRDRRIQKWAGSGNKSADRSATDR